MADFKQGETFYYVLPCHHTNESGKDCVDYKVFAYYFDEKWHSCFDESMMFANRADAEKKAMELNAK